MRDRMERLVVLPFSAGCLSPSSVDVCNIQQQHRRSSSSKTPDTNSSPTGTQEGDESSSSSDVNMKSSLKFLAVPKPQISTGFHRLYKGFKNFSLSLANREELGMEMEIGFPTNVKHLTHIGLDGPDDETAAANNNNPLKAWENLASPEFLSLHPLSLAKKFELAMVARPPISSSPSQIG